MSQSGIEPTIPRFHPGAVDNLATPTVDELWFKLLHYLAIWIKSDTCDNTYIELIMNIVTSWWTSWLMDQISKNLTFNKFSMIRQNKKKTMFFWNDST